MIDGAALLKGAALRQATPAMLRPAPHVHVALVSGDLVFLDAAADQYLCLPKRLSTFLLGEAASEGPLLPEIGALISELKDAGLVTGEGERLALPDPARATLAETDIYQLQPARRTPTIKEAAAFLAAAGLTMIAIRCAKPRQWLETLTRVPSKRKSSPASAPDLAAVFERMRPLIPRSGRCLPSSMMLMIFMRLNGVQPCWVFGVRTHPFEAHCWLEHEGAVLNDTVEHVRWFTPILAA